ncbi:MAG: dTMP kinase [Candidatus Omnitrophica bacterium]|nr:dTMP kinase [Candidatus Omnitrophota bacterium]
MASRKMKRGLFITFDGPEGCGKSTQAKALARWLRTRGFSVVLTRDPGGSPIAEEIRGLLLDPRHKELSPLAEMLLYETSRASLVKKVILPALRKGELVVCDRFSDATRVYQGIAGGVCECLIAEIDEEVCEGLKPDITFFLDVSSRRGALRLRRRGRLDRMEGKPLRFHEGVRRGYRKIAKEFPKRIRFISDAPLEKVKQKIVEEMTGVLRRHFGSVPRR